VWYIGLQVDMIEYFIVYQAASGYDRVPRGILGCRSVSIGYFKSRCNASGCKVEQTSQICKERTVQVRARS
jgi:hypothetical protein